MFPSFQQASPGGQTRVPRLSGLLLYLLIDPMGPGNDFKMNMPVQILAGVVTFMKFEKKNCSVCEVNSLALTVLHVQAPVRPLFRKSAMSQFYVKSNQKASDAGSTDLKT